MTHASGTARAAAVARIAIDAAAAPGEASAARRLSLRPEHIALRMRLTSSLRVLCDAHRSRLRETPGQEWSSARLGDPARALCRLGKPVLASTWGRAGAALGQHAECLAHIVAARLDDQTAVARVPAMRRTLSCGKELPGSDRRRSRRRHAEPAVGQA